MRRKLVVMLVLGVIVSAFAIISPAAAADRELVVYVDGELLEFRTQPFIENGSTMVPFRTIFEALGLDVSWDEGTKTVTGDRDGLSIALVIGSKSAVVNGVQKELAVAPVIKDGFTFVPLRFVSENAQKEVNWDPYLREVYIADAVDQVLNLFLRQYEFMNTENLDGYMNTIDPDSPLFDSTRASLESTFDIYDLESEADITVTELDSKVGVGVVETIQTTVKLAGPDYQDTVTVAYHDVVRIDGVWKVSASQLAYIDYMKSELYPKGEVTLDVAGLQAVKDVIEQHRVYRNNREFEKDRELYAKDYPNLEDELARAKAQSEAYKLSYTYEDVEFIEASADKAIVKLTSTVIDVEADSDFQSFAAEYVIQLSKGTDGKWKFTQSDLLGVELLYE